MGRTGRRSASHSRAELAPARAPAARQPVCAVGLVGRQDHAFTPPGARCPVLSWGQAGSGGVATTWLHGRGRVSRRGGVWNVPLQSMGSHCGFLGAGGAEWASGFTRGSSGEEVRRPGRFGEWASVTLRKGE